MLARRSYSTSELIRRWPPTPMLYPMLYPMPPGLLPALPPFLTQAAAPACW